jgi:hypothetical protein
MKLRRIPLLAVLLAISFLAAVGVFSQDTGMDEPEGCCWVHFWGEAAFVGEDNVVDGPGEWPNGLDEVPTGSFTTGACATVTLWPQADYQGEPVEYGPEQQVPELPFAQVGSMKMTCEGE